MGAVRDSITIATHAGLTSALAGDDDVASIRLDLTGSFVVVRLKNGRSFVVEVREEPEAAAA